MGWSPPTTIAQELVEAELVVPGLPGLVTRWWLNDLMMTLIEPIKEPIKYRKWLRNPLRKMMTQDSMVALMG